jgi:hypothetical protein
VTSSSGQERYQRATAAAQPSPNSSSAATRRFAATAAMTATVELPVGLMVLGTSYIALTIVIGLANAVLTAPLMAMIRRKSAYFDDWNEGLKAPWVFWRIGGLWFRITGACVVCAFALCAGHVLRAAEAAEQHAPHCPPRPVVL